MLQARRVSEAALLLLPAALVLYFAFNSGGFYPGPPAYAAALLCIVLLLRLAVSATPFAGVSRQLLLGGGALFALSLFTLASGLWSHAPGLARVEFDLPLVYLLALLLFGSTGRTRGRLRWMLRALAAAIVIVCTCGLITRLLPHVWPTAVEIANNRLGFPVTYWNVLGLLAGIGIILCVHLSSDLGEPGLARMLAAAAVPILAGTLYFTFSRGAIAACLIGLLVYLLVARPRGLLGSCPAIGVPTTVALKLAYDANLLATPNPTTPGAVAQGRHVAMAVAACVVGGAVLRFVLIPLDLRLSRMELPRKVRAVRGWHVWAAAAVATVIVVVALRGTIAHEYHRFVHPLGSTSADLRARLTDPFNNGRLDYWRVAVHQFELAPVAGRGAGTYADAYAQHRGQSSYYVDDAHSLYLETLDELGVVGLALLLITILTVLARVASRARGTGRSLYGAVLAVQLAWALHAAVDWDWEMPVVTIIFFSLGGFVLGRRPRVDEVTAAAHVDATGRATPPVSRMPWPARAAAAVALIPLAMAPAYMWLSQRRLDDAYYSFSSGNCQLGRTQALSSVSILGDRAEPYEVLSFCDAQLGASQDAVKAITKAVSLDPNNWNYRYDQALMLAAAGRDPRAAAAEAVSLDPRESLVQDAWRNFRSGSAAQWQKYAQAQISSINNL